MKKGNTSDGWKADPVLVWIGPVGEQAPNCSEHGLSAGEPRFTDPEAGPCGPCTCEDPTGACGLPTEIKVHAGPCSGPPVTEVPFDPLQDWDGTCSADDMIMQNAPCPEGNCVQSVTVAPLVVTKDECAAVIAPPRGPEPYFKKRAVICHGEEVGECKQEEGKYQFCAPTAPAGFRVCILSEGDRNCPPDLEGAPSEYREKHLLSTRVTRTCSCTCTPAGSKCTATLSFYRDAACTDLVDDLPFASTGESCVDIMPTGQALRSKAISPPVYVPGKCEPSSKAGAIELEDAYTYCCIPAISNQDDPPKN